MCTAKYFYIIPSAILYYIIYIDIYHKLNQICIFFPEFPGCTTTSTTFTIWTETLLLWQLKTPVFLNCCFYKPLHLSVPCWWAATLLVKSFSIWLTPGWQWRTTVDMTFLGHCIGCCHSLVGRHTTWPTISTLKGTSPPTSDTGITSLGPYCPFQ